MDEQKTNTTDKKYSADEVLSEFRGKFQSVKPREEKWWYAYIPEETLRKNREKAVGTVEGEETPRAFPEEDRSEKDSSAAETESDIFTLKQESSSLPGTPKEAEPDSMTNEPAVQTAFVLEEKEMRHLPDADQADGQHELWLGISEENEEALDMTREFSVFQTDEFTAEPPPAPLQKQETARKIRQAILGIEELDDPQFDFDQMDEEKTAQLPKELAHTEACDSGTDLPQSKEEIDAYIRLTKNRLIWRLFAAAAGTILLLYLGFAPMYPLPVPARIDPFVNAFGYITANLVILLAVLLCAWPVLTQGLKNMILFRLDADSLTAVAAVSVLVQNIGLLSLGTVFSRQGPFLFNSVIGFGLIFNTIGKLLAVSRTKTGYQIVSDVEEKRACVMLENQETSRLLIKDMKVSGNSVYKPIRTGEVREYLEKTAEADASEKSLRFAALPVAVLGVLGAVFYFVRTGSLPDAFSCFAAVCCICAPFTAQMTSNFPFWRTAKYLAESGSAILGFGSVEQVSEIGAVVVDANRLFPKGSVMLHGIKTFGSYRIDEAIIDAASVVCESGGPLSNVFLNVIENKTSILRKVDNLVYEEALGLSAWVDGRRVLVGNSALIAAHGIDVPSQDYERKYMREGRSLVYVSVSGVLSAMFVVSYKPLEAVAEMLDRMRNNGVGILVTSRDSNVTAGMVSDLFLFPADMVRVLPQKDIRQLGSSRYDGVNAGMIYSAGAPALFESIIASLRLGVTVKTGAFLQMAGIILGFLFILYLILTLSVGVFTLKELLIWHLVWTGIVFLFGATRNPV